MAFVKGNEIRPASYKPQGRVINAIQGFKHGDFVHPHKKHSDLFLWWRGKQILFLHMKQYQIRCSLFRHKVLFSNLDMFRRRTFRLRGRRTLCLKTEHLIYTYNRHNELNRIMKRHQFGVSLWRRSSSSSNIYIHYIKQSTEAERRINTAVFCFFKENQTSVG